MMNLNSKKGIVRYLRYTLNGDLNHPRGARRKKQRRGPVRDWRYRAWIRTLPSAVSGRRGPNGKCEAAHTGTDGGMRMKASDLTCIPLTPEEHLEYHRIGRQAFEERYGINCAEIVQKLNATWFRFAKEVK